MLIPSASVVFRFPLAPPAHGATFESNASQGHLPVQASGQKVAAADLTAGEASVVRFRCRDELKVCVRGNLRNPRGWPMRGLLWHSRYHFFAAEREP